MLLANKENMKELKEISIHQLVALKAYILELDGKLRDMLRSNDYLLKKYKSYKEKYQGVLREQKQERLQANNLKMKIMGYDKLVLKLQGELEHMIRANESEVLLAQQRNVE
ncbi:unnamed protein product [Sphagnum balticum]